MHDIIDDAPRHTPSGRAEVNGVGFLCLRGETRTCADCAWSFPGRFSARVLRCRKASDARVESDWRGCVRADFNLDCQDCGVCCGGAFSEVPVEPGERLRELHPELVTRSRIGWVMTRKGAACVALARDGCRVSCTLYPIRPKACRDFERASAECLEARRYLDAGA